MKLWRIEKLYSTDVAAVPVHREKKEIKKTSPTSSRPILAHATYRSGLETY